MKKLVSVLLLLCLMISPAFAEIDLSGLSFDELVALRSQCLTEMTKRDEWQEVTVPVGVWKIGEDIPAGHWNITCYRTDKYAYAVVYYTDELDATKKKASNRGKFHYADMVKVDGSPAMTNNTVLDIDMIEGAYLVIERCPVVLSPYTGKPDLGFK